MTLEQLISALQPLVFAYSPDTQVRVNLRDSIAEIVGISAKSSPDETFVEIAAQQ